MAPWAGYKLRRICANTSNVLAIELLAAAHAIDKLKPLQTTDRLQQVHAFVRRHVEYRPYDHRLDRDIAKLAELIESGTLSSFLRGDGAEAGDRGPEV
jgi:histidine ammonia-lyase